MGGWQIVPMIPKKLMQSFLRGFGYELRRLKDAGPANVDMEPEFKELAKLCMPFTMTSVERMYSLWQTVKYVSVNKIPGDIVECGVWKGGSSMLTALTLKSLGDLNRKIYLYDTFAGMTEPTSEDVSYKGTGAFETFSSHQKENFNEWAFAGLDEVKQNLLSTGYPQSQLEFVKGKVEETIPRISPQSISLLRLDTDWYESTKHELEHLYPRVSANGVIIVDDYGHWLGARKATDEYLEGQNHRPLLQRIDYTGRLMIKSK